MGDTSFSYRLSDGAGGAATGTVTIHVTNAAPSLDPVADQVVMEGGTITLDLAGSDADGDALRYSLVQGPTTATLDPVTGRFRWTADSLDPQSVQVSVSDPSGATALRQFTVNVQLGRLVVTSFQQQAWGFSVRFNDVLDTSVLNTYGAATPDVTVTGATTGAVRGSVVMDDDGRGFAFIRTGAQLVADRYTVLVRGAADGVTNSRRGALDGDANGSAGGNYLNAFSVAAVPAVRLRLPDFARGPGQAANVPNTASGIPVSLVSDGTVRSVSMRLRADVDTLSISAIGRGADLPADAGLTVTKVADGQFDIVVSRGTALPVGTLRLLSVTASVPGSAVLGDSGAIVLERVQVNGVDAPLAGDAAVDLVAFPGDVDFDRAYTASDVTLMGRIGTGLTTSLPQLPRIDLNILADVDGNGVVNAMDTAQVLARSRATATAVLPAIPAAAPSPAPLPLLALSVPATSSASGSGGTGNGAGASTATGTGTGSPAVNLAGSFSNFSTDGGTSPQVQPQVSLNVALSVKSSGVSA